MFLLNMLTIFARKQRQQQPPDKRQRLGDYSMQYPDGGGAQRGSMPPPWGPVGGKPGPGGGQGGMGGYGGGEGGMVGGGRGASDYYGQGGNGLNQLQMATSMAPPPMFFAAGGMDVLVDMMQKDDPKEKKQAAQAVVEACADNPENQQLVKQAGAVEKMVKMLHHEENVDVKSKAAEALAAACSHNRENRVEALKANALEPLVEMLAGNIQTQESAAHALANVIIPREGAGAVPDLEVHADDKTKLDCEKDYNKEETAKGQKNLSDMGGVTKLINLVETGAPRVREAAAAAVANAMVDNPANRQAFQEAGGIGPLIGLLKSGDPLAQEHATTALCNAMVDNDDTRVCACRRRPCESCSSVCVRKR